MRPGAVRALALVLVAFAHAAWGADPWPPLPAGLDAGTDLRGVYRSALCERPDVATGDCARMLLRFAGEVPAPRPPTADGRRYRLLFVPGFMAGCFPSIHSFADVVAAAREAGYAAEVLAVGGRNDTAANARLIAGQIERLPDDGRRLVLIGHSKGALDLLETLRRRPDLANRVAAVLTVAGALHGSPLAAELHGLYGLTLGLLPFASCDRGEGDPVRDMQPAVRDAWWTRYGPELRTPIYSLVTLPDLDRLSTSLLMPYLSLARFSRDNDGMLLSRGQSVAQGALLGVVNADHLSVAIPYPGDAWFFVFTSLPFPRPQVTLAAIDVIAERLENAARRAQVQ